MNLPRGDALRSDGIAAKEPVPWLRWMAGGVGEHLPGPHRVFLLALPLAIVLVVAAVDLAAGPDVGFLPVLSVGPALAAIYWRPAPTAIFGLVVLAAGALLGNYDAELDSRRGVISLCAIAGVTIAGVVASGVRQRRERELADLQAIAEAAQQVLLRPVPGRLASVNVAVRYVSAAAPARIGGDLYEAVAVEGGVRLIVGDVLGKGLPAARTAAVVLGAFREAAYDAPDLAWIAGRIEASLQHQQAGEEFVTVVLAQVSADGSKVSILNCGHPPPLLVHGGQALVTEQPDAGLPLGLASLAKARRETCVTQFAPGDRLLFYTDGITEARDKQGRFYRLEQAAAFLSGQDLGGCLDQLMEDVLRHVGHALFDDAALLLISRAQEQP